MRWDVEPNLVQYQLGTDDLEAVEDGCPGGDQMSGLLHSIAPFTRRTDQQRNRVSNPRLDSAPELVQMAVLDLEHHEDSSAGERIANDDRLLEKRGKSMPGGDHDGA